MKTLYKALIILILIAGTVVFLTQPLATTSLSGTPTPITFEDDLGSGPAPGNFYIGTATIKGDDTRYQLIPAGKDPEHVMGLQFDARDSMWLANVKTPPSVLYYSQIGYGLLNVPYNDRQPIPYKTVDMGNTRVSVSADVFLALPDGSIIEKVIGNTGEHTQQFTVKDKDGIDRTIYIRYNELKWVDGRLTPSGDYDIITAPDGYERWITHDNLVDGTGTLEKLLPCATPGTWECYFTGEVFYLSVGDIDEYREYYTWMTTNGKIPEVMHTEFYEVVDNELQVYYPSTTFSQGVTFYVPEELGYLLIVEQVPEFKFDAIADISTNEDALTIVEVTGTAVHGGTINLHVDGAGVTSYHWVDGSEKQLKKGDRYKFILHMTSPDVFDDRKLPITIYSQPSGMGVATQVTFYNNVANTDDKNWYDLTVKCIDANDNVVEDAEIFIDNVSVGFGSTTKNLVEGEHYVWAENTTTWYSRHPIEHYKELSVKEDTEFIIPYTAEPPVYKDYKLIMMLGGIGVILVIVGSILANKAGAKVTTTHTIVLIVLIALLTGGYIVTDIAIGLIERFIEAIENFKLFGGLI